MPKPVIITLRVALGAYLASMGVAKALDPVTFLKTLHQYGWLASPFPLNAVAALLPWFEILCGLLLFTGFFLRGATLASLAMFALFTAAIALRTYELSQAQDLAYCAVRFDCGCGAGVVRACHKLIENALCLAALLGILIARLLQAPAPPAARSSESAASPAPPA